jgi:hypothetical protein
VDFQGHQDWDFHGAEDCGLLGTLDERYLQARPPNAGLGCPVNPSEHNATVVVKEQYDLFVDANLQKQADAITHLSKCSVQHSSCSGFCITGGVAAEECVASTFEAFLVFNGAFLGMTLKLEDKISNIEWIDYWKASSGGDAAESHNQHTDQGPIPEGAWKLGQNNDLSPCCGTELFQRTAFSSGPVAEYFAHRRLLHFHPRVESSSAGKLGGLLQHLLPIHWFWAHEYC